jgi:Zn-dependent protease with chaperone function
MEDIYPTGPASVPSDLTRPTASYKRHAYLAVAGLLAFVVAYFALAGWFAWTAYRLLSSLVRAPQHLVVLAAGGAGAAFLAIFMLKAVIPSRRKPDQERELEVTAAAHPRLFAFLHRLADEARAPRPHRVFLSARVNAAVFYELTIANLLLPSKKNLEIGLGLVNVLTLAELKAVLAHELGHFAQRTMAVGRWVYTAQQIAAHIVGKRDGLDHALHALSSFDIRVAWIGWLLRIIVWSIRSLVDTFFGWVVLAQRALSREMELQADLVSVSLAGSDAIVHALHRLEAADDALDRALGFTGGELRSGRAVADVFAIQTHMLERKRAILDDPTYGTVPPLPAEPAAHRIFKEQLAHPPRMWATHPPSELREANAKRVYVSAPLDDRSSWLLFSEPEALRAEVSASLLAGSGKELTKVPIAESLAAIDKAFERRYFDPSYRGVYLGRSPMSAAENVAALYGSAAESTSSHVEALDALYPPTLSGELALVRELGHEKAALEALRKGLLEATGRVVRFRGQDRKR